MAFINQVPNLSLQSKTKDNNVVDTQERHRKSKRHTNGYTPPQKENTPTLLNIIGRKGYKCKKNYNFAIFLTITQMLLLGFSFVIWKRR
jgi:hypothetical protein